MSQVAGPDGKSLIVLSRLIRTASDTGDRRFNVAVAEERGRGDDPIARFGNNLLAALIVLGLALVVAAILQVHFGLRPLVLLGRQIDDVRRGEAERLPENAPRDLLPVTRQINDLLEAQDASITSARQRAADLAHGLKTPLAVLSATSDRLRGNGDAASADTLDMIIEQMNTRVEYQLRLSRLRHRTRAQGDSSSLNDVVLRSVSVLRLSHEGESLHWLVELEGNLLVDADSHDLMELTGILLENAAQWANSKVQVIGARRDREIEFVVEDDGRGLTDEQIARLGVRGLRLDERGSGDGLGISIASEIVALNGGTMVVDRSHLGGLRTTLRLPSALPETPLSGLP